MTTVRTLAVFGLTLTVLLSSAFAATVKKGSTIAFLRNGDIWLMESDGSNQRAWINGIGNAKGRMSWSPDNRKLAFTRSGQIALKYPDGGGGQHLLYDLFYAYADSNKSFWEGITETMGAYSPQFSRDGARILFSHDLAKNTVNATRPDYRICFYDVKTRLLRDLDHNPASEFTLHSPTISPDGRQVAFIVMRIRGEQMTPVGIAIAGVDEFPLSDAELQSRAQKWAGATMPQWSPDGQWIAYLSSDMKNQGLWITTPDLTGKKKLYSPPEGLSLNNENPSWSPDSRMIAFSTGNGSIYKISVDGGEPTRISGPGGDSQPAWCN